jgi:hypothetical protein
MAVQRLSRLKPGTRYRLTFWVKCRDVVPVPAAQALSGAVVNISAGRNLWFPAGGFSGSFDWTRQGFDFETPDDFGAGNPYMRLWLKRAGGTVWLDDVHLVERERNQ